MYARGEPSVLLALFILLVTGSTQSAGSADISTEGTSCDQERLELCKACGTPDLLDDCCLDDATYFMCLKEVSKQPDESQFWDGNKGTDEFDEEEKRAKYFLGKRAKYFLGKRIRNNFLGKRDADFDLDDDQFEGYEDKRARHPFLGKRPKMPFLGKRAKYFLGKREADFDDLPMGEGYYDEADKRAKYFLGKRAKYFLGKRGSWEDLLKRAKYFLGKRSDDKRQKYFLGKRSIDAVQEQQLQQQQQQHQDNSQ